MSHLIETIHNTTIDKAIHLLTKTHSIIVEQIIEAKIFFLRYKRYVYPSPMSRPIL